MSAEETAFAGLAERGETSPGAEMVNGTSPTSSDGAEAPGVAHSSAPMN